MRRRGTLAVRISPLLSSVAFLLVTVLIFAVGLVVSTPKTAVAAAGQAPALSADWQNITAGGDPGNIDTKTVNLSATGNADTSPTGKLDVVAMIDTGFNMGDGSVDAATNAVKALANQVLSINSIMGDTSDATAPVRLDVGFSRRQNQTL